MHWHERVPWVSAVQLGVSGILVLDARKGGPAYKAGIKGTTRDHYGRLGAHWAGYCCWTCHSSVAARMTTQGNGVSNRTDWVLP